MEAADWRLEKRPRFQNKILFVQSDNRSVMESYTALPITDTDHQFHWLKWHLLLVDLPAVAPVNKSSDFISHRSLNVVKKTKLSLNSLRTPRDEICVKCLIGQND